jgi:hypothetical protein
MTFKQRCLGAYGILLCGSFLISLGMEGDSASRANPIYMFASYIVWILILPPIIAGTGYVIVRLSILVIEQNEAKKNELAGKIAEAERLEERVRRAEIYRIAEERKRLDDERERCKTQKTNEAVAKKETQERLNRTTIEAKHAALGDF